MRQAAREAIIRRNRVRTRGADAPAMVFAHGFGCDQSTWRFVAPRFEDRFRTVVYDLTGSGESDLSAYDRERYATLHGHAEDLLAVCDALELEAPIVVGHSVSAMSAVLAANDAPGRFSRLVLVAPSPCYRNDGDYRGGFEAEDLEQLLAVMDENYLGWSGQMVPGILGAGAEPEVVDDLTRSFCRTDPAIARHFARVTFLGDYRADVRRLTAPSLVLQCSDDMIAPRQVGDWIRSQAARATLHVLSATGHCPHLTAPAETVSAIDAWLS